jgi:hypothetical protein
MTWVPEACTLPTVEQPLRVAEFDDVFAVAVRAPERVGPDVLRLFLPPGEPLLSTMPNSVFFAPGGIALHGGSPSRASAGCIHVPQGTDEQVFNFLNVGDEVQVVQSLDKVKGGFYKVNKLKKPTKKQLKANEDKVADARKKAAGGTNPADGKKKDGDKRDKKKNGKD